MKKTSVLITLIAMAVFAFSACSLKDNEGGVKDLNTKASTAEASSKDENTTALAQEASSENENSSSLSQEVSSEKEDIDSQDGDNALADESEDTSVMIADFDLIADFDFEKVPVSEEAAMYAHITAKDDAGNTLWEYDTEKVYVTELDNLQELGISTAGYLINLGGYVQCIDVTNSKECSFLWRNESNVGASCTYKFADDGSLYIGGYYGPDLTVIGFDGKTISQFDTFTYPEGVDDSDFFWLYSMELDEDDQTKGTMCYEGGEGHKIRVDFGTGEVIEIIE